MKKGSLHYITSNNTYILKVWLNKWIEYSIWVSLKNTKLFVKRFKTLCYYEECVWCLYSLRFISILPPICQCYFSSINEFVIKVTRSQVDDTSSRYFILSPTNAMLSNILGTVSILDQFKILESSFRIVWKWNVLHYFESTLQRAVFSYKNQHWSIHLMQKIQ